MAPMNEDELKQMLDRMYGGQKRSMLRISNDEKIPAAPIDGGIETAQNLRSANTPDSQIGGEHMSKMSVQELDELRSRNRMKVRKVQQGALTVVTPVTPVAVPQAVTSTASATTPVDLVQLKRDIAEWTALQLMLNNPRRHFARQETKTKLTAFVLYYMMAALLVGIIWAAAGH
jgi:hypothetical protein